MTEFQQVPDFDMWIRVGDKYPIGFLRDKAIELRSHPKQLSRSNARYLVLAKEEIPVFLGLRKRLEQTIPESVLARFWRLQRGRQYAHSMVRAFIRGDFAAVSEIWKALKIMKKPWLQMMIWFISANGRIFRTGPKANMLFDAYSPLVPNDAELLDRENFASIIKI